MKRARSAMNRSADVDRWRAFSTCVLGHIARLAGGDAAYAQIMTDMAEAIATTKSSRGLRQVVGDLLEWTQDLKGDQLASIDADLAEQGLPTLTLVRARSDRKFAEILARGLIRDEDEYRLVSARLGDTGSDLLESDRVLGDRLLSELKR